MLAHRIALAVATVVLAAPATAFASNADGATPTATPLFAELAVAALVILGLAARRRVAQLARAAGSRLAQMKAIRRLPRPARFSGR